MDLDASHLFSGPAVRVVRARPADAGRIGNFYLGLSRESRYERFFSHRPEFAQEELHRLSHPDPSSELCMIALAGEPGDEIVVGDARCVAGNSEAGPAISDGEIALVVADDWRRRGVGRALMCGLIAAARHERYDGLTAYITATNAGMLTLIREFNFRAVADGSGATVRLLRKEMRQIQYQVDPGCRAQPREALAESAA